MGFFLFHSYEGKKKKLLFLCSLTAALQLFSWQVCGLLFYQIIFLDINL